MYPWNRETVKLLDIAEKIEEARSDLDAAKKAANALHVEVTDPLAAAIVSIDKSLSALDSEIGKASRKDHRERPRAMDSSDA